MPSLLSPAAGAGSRSYTPLADEVNPPFGNHAPAVTRNGTVVYGKRASPVSDTTADMPGLADDNHARYSGNGDGHTNGVVPIYRSGSNETLSTISTIDPASFKGKGKERAVVQEQDQVYVPEDEDGDIGELRRGGTLRAGTYGYQDGKPDWKGKGKERAWDPEMGQQEVVQESYPPGNDALDAERRIQDNLAKFAARDMARRRAARLSKQAPVSPTLAQTASPTSTTTSFMRRPFSMIGPIGGGGGGGGEPKRNSVMGIMGAFIGGGSGGASAQRDELPLASPTRPHMAVNPYDPPPRGLSPTPRMVSPSSPHYPSPFADPLPSPSPRHDHPDLRRDSLASSATSPPIQSPTDGEGFTYGYAGAGWRGGAGAVPPTGPDGALAVGPPPKPPRGERWWHALCSWGDDLDGGHDDQNEGRNQAGRTNPFE